MNTRSLRGLYSPELLESRIAPATIIVTSLADDGGGVLKTLREAIVEANVSAAADTIVFAPAILPGTITLGGTDIDITGTLTIKGPGIDKLTISGNNASRIFNIGDGDGAVLRPTTISGIRLVDGNAGLYNGGAIYSTEPLSLKDVALFSNETDGRGGGVAVATTGKVSFNHVQLFANNSASSGGGAFLYANAGISIVRSLFASNYATDGGGGLDARVFLATATIAVDGSFFAGNVSGTDDGGAISLDHAGSGKMTLKNSILTGNNAAGSGGAVYLNDGKVTVDRCVFAGNFAGGKGGALADDLVDALAIANSRFEGNTAPLGGALYLRGAHPVSVTGSTFTGNDSTGAGGAIAARGGIALTVKTSTLAGNTAATNGGAIDLADAGTSLLLASSTVSGNTAAASGGGIDSRLGSKLTVTGGVFSGNTAGLDGGGIHTSGIGVDAVNVSVNGTLFQGNRAGFNGGAVFTADDGTVLIKSVRAIGNRAGAESGGGMYLRSNTSVTVHGSLFQQNGSGDKGGGLLIRLGSALAVGSVTSSKFLDNFATFGGGTCLYGVAGSAVTVKGSLITGNLAGTTGGGVLKIGALTLTLIATVITGNGAPNTPNGP